MNACNFNIKVLKLVKRLSLWEQYPEEWELMRLHFDLVLCRHVVHFKSQGKTGSFWWKSASKYADLLLPLHATQSAFDCEDSWETAAKHITEAYGSSRVGKML